MSIPDTSTAVLHILFSLRKADCARLGVPKPVPEEDSEPSREGSDMLESQELADSKDLGAEPTPFEATCQCP